LRLLSPLRLLLLLLLLPACRRQGKVTVCMNPLTNTSLQDRRGQAASVGTVIPADAPHTPRWRGITAVQELAAAGVAVAAASDNVRDHWHRYGDYDLLEVFGWVRR
jgi:cytosine deaminase